MQRHQTPLEELNRILRKNKLNSNRNKDKFSSELVDHPNTLSYNTTQHHQICQKFP